MIWISLPRPKNLTSATRPPCYVALPSPIQFFVEECRSGLDHPALIIQTEWNFPSGRVGGGEVLLMRSAGHRSGIPSGPSLHSICSQSDEPPSCQVLNPPTSTTSITGSYRSIRPNATQVKIITRTTRGGLPRCDCSKVVYANITPKETDKANAVGVLHDLLDLATIPSARQKIIFVTEPSRCHKTFPYRVGLWARKCHHSPAAIDLRSLTGSDHRVLESNKRVKLSNRPNVSHSAGEIPDENLTSSDRPLRSSSVQRMWAQTLR